jgi:hypothetical protein
VPSPTDHEAELEQVLARYNLAIESGLPADPQVKMQCAALLEKLAKYEEALTAYEEAASICKSSGHDPTPEML